jgi:hypothetical protein
VEFFMATYAVQGNDNALDLDLSSIQSGSVTTSTAHKVVVQASDGREFTFRGNFSGGNGSNFPTGGTITGWASSSESGTARVTGISMPVPDFNTFLDNDNIAGLERAVFMSADTVNLTSSDGLSHTSGFAGDDNFFLGNTFTDDTAVYGGSGHDTVHLGGEYTGLHFAPTSLNSVEELTLRGGHNYAITTDDGNVAAGRAMLINATSLGGADILQFDGTDERDGSFRFHLGDAQNATVAGGLGNDVFTGGGIGGALRGGGGNDTFQFGGQFNASVDGGVGTNTVRLDGDYSEGLTFGDASLIDVRYLRLSAGHSYNLILNAANVPDGNGMTVDGHALGVHTALRLDGSNVAGNLVIEGGDAKDTLIGGQGNNLFAGGNGADSINALGTHNRFAYHAADESSGRGHDTIIGFNGSTDRFNLNTAVDKIDTAITKGRLSDAHFNADLAAAADSDHLGAHDAVLFTASSGVHADETFLIVDMNGNAGYQAGHDLVVELNDATHLGALSASNFI